VSEPDAACNQAPIVRCDRSKATVAHVVIVMSPSNRSPFSSVAITPKVASVFAKADKNPIDPDSGANEPSRPMSMVNGPEGPSIWTSDPGWSPAPLNVIPPLRLVAHTSPTSFDTQTAGLSDPQPAAASTDEVSTTNVAHSTQG
jgi:hypothetical protein